MKISPAGIAGIKRHEGLRLHAYLDSAGVPTIGHGHTQGVALGQHISELQAEAFLRDDLAWAETAVNNAITVPITQAQFDALVSLCFNIGASAFGKSTLVREINAGNIAEAADEFLRWDKITVNGEKRALPGLASRRAAERAMFLSWPADAGVHVGPEPAPSPAPRPDAEPYTQETPMVAPAIAIAGSFLLELAKSAISAFTPLAQEKLTKEMGRHTNNPAVAAQVASAIIDTAKAATSKADPMEAVVEARKDPEIVQQMEASALGELDRLMPVLEKMQRWEADAWAAEEESRRNADARALASEKDQDEFLTRAIIALFVGLLVFLGVLIGVLVYLKADSGTIGTLVGLFAAAGGATVGALNTRIQHRYGSSRGSAAKDTLAAELARRPKVA